MNIFSYNWFFVETTEQMSKVVLDPIEQYVIDTVRRMRIERGLSQKDLAFALDLSIGFIGDVESSKERAKYNLAHINKLAKIFECSPKDFLPEKPLSDA